MNGQFSTLLPRGRSCWYILILTNEARRTYLNELDARKPLVLSIPQRSKDLRLHNSSLDFNDFNPLLKSCIFKCIFWLKGSFFFWGDNRDFLKEGVKTYQISPMLPLTWQLIFLLHIYSLWSQRQSGISQRCLFLTESFFVASQKRLLGDKPSRRRSDVLSAIVTSESVLKGPPTKMSRLVTLIAMAFARCRKSRFVCSSPRCLFYSDAFVSAQFIDHPP